MRDDEISSFPRFCEVLLEPFDGGEVYEVGWLIEEEEFRSREEYLCKCYFGTFSS
jgi:hypothetical protein